MQYTDFHFPNRLSKVLAGAGVASRRSCEQLIFGGRVSVNNKTVTTPQTLVNKDDLIAIDGKSVSLQEKVYFILNKPKGFICSSKTSLNTKSKLVLDLFEDQPERLFTIGRLDRDTEGLLLVTNDGHFAQKVIHPSSNIEKEYLAKTDREVTHEHLVAISSGTQVEGVFVRPIRVTKVRRGTVKVSVAEGKKREVRTLLEAAGLNVRELSRIRIGGLFLGSLPVGQWRPMTENEKEAIFN